jgi:type I restriction enzyme, S subunit
MSEDNGKIPNNWVEVSLGTICNTTSGGTPSRAKSAYFGGTIPWLKSGELNDNIVREAEECISQDGLDNSSTKIIPKNTLMIALYGATVGKLGILGFDSAINQAICAIKTPKGIIVKFLFWFLRKHKNNLLKLRKGGAQPNISQMVVNDILLPLPPLNEQHRIVLKIEELFTKLGAGEADLKRAKEKIRLYKKSILKSAVEGKLTEE